jgi:hypothetical protein
MLMKLYQYVGPESIRARSRAMPGGRFIGSPGEFRSWLSEADVTVARHELIAATFVIDPEGKLRLADRRSEHVACAGGGPVLSAGEMFFAPAGEIIVVEEVSNLSTGYCPEPRSWYAVGEALDRLGITHPGRFTTEVVFRRCTHWGNGTWSRTPGSSARSAAANCPKPGTSRRRTSDEEPERWLPRKRPVVHNS